MRDEMTRLQSLRAATSAMLLIAIWIACALVYSPAGAQSTSGPDRLDFTAAEGQTAYVTSNVFPKPNVQVFRNGLLQRQGPAPFDYTQQYIQNGVRIRITFNPGQTLGPVPATGDYITLFYYR